VFAGGLAILLALFELFDIQDMSVSEISLREGVLYDLVGRSTSQDIRNITVTAMLNRWSVDPNHGEKVSKTALSIYQQVCDAWNIQDLLYKKCLGWAAQLHELGLHVSHDGYHKHGAYLLAKADMAGFARRDQLLLSALVQGHRRKFPIYQFEQLPSALVTPAKRIAVILRLAVLLHRGRHANKIPELLVSVDAQDFILNFKNNWLLDNPLTLADLNQEQTWLKAIGVNLKFN